MGKVPTVDTGSLRLCFREVALFSQNLPTCILAPGAAILACVPSGWTDAAGFGGSALTDGWAPGPVAGGPRGLGHDLVHTVVAPH